MKICVQVKVAFEKEALPSMIFLVVELMNRSVPCVFLRGAGREEVVVDLVA